MDSKKICFYLGIASFIIGFLLIFINAYWILYGIAFFVLGILDMCLYKKTVYLKVAGMIYVTLAFFAGVGMIEFFHMIIPFGICASYASVFLLQGFKKKHRYDLK